MNLRFESNTIRVRVSAEEAEKLFIEKYFSATFPFPGKFIFFKILCSLDTKVTSISLNENFEMYIPFSDLERLIHPPAHSSERCDELSGTFTSNGQSVVLRFEIDRFSRKRKI